MNTAGARLPREQTTTSSVRRALSWSLPLLALALALPSLWRLSPLADADSGQATVRSALAEGNRAVRDGELAVAVDVYTAGWSEGARGDVAGVLAYNLGTTLHRLDRRPEALLWYLRAMPLRPGDRWLADNLALVRSELGAPRRPPPGAAATLLSHRDALSLAAVATAWLALALSLLQRRRVATSPEPGGRAGLAGGAGMSVAVASLLLWLAAATLSPLGPRPAVLLAPCGDDTEVGTTHGEERAIDPGRDPDLPSSPGAENTLPAGSEVWVRSSPDAGWSLVGEPSVACPEGAIAVP